jgi:hypothetical protein
MTLAPLVAVAAAVFGMNTMDAARRPRRWCSLELSEVQDLKLANDLESGFKIDFDVTQDSVASRVTTRAIVGGRPNGADKPSN